MSSVSKRYAKALLVLGREDGDPRGYLEELKMLKGTLEDEGLRDFLEHPAIPMAVRCETLFEIARRVGVRPGLLQLLGVMIAKDRMAFFSQIVDHYERLLERELGLMPVRIVSATPLESEEQIGRASCRERV